MKFVFDMNLGHDWVKLFSSNNLEAVHWSQVGEAAAKDTYIMEWALQNTAVIVTQDLDFAHLHAIAGSQFPSIVQIRHDDLRPSSIGNTVMLAIQNTEALLRKGAVLTVEPPLARIRPLPIISNNEE